MSFAERQQSEFIRSYKKFQEQFDSLYWRKKPDWHLEFKDSKDEKFKPIDEYQGFYFISNYGKVISFKRKLPGVRRPAMISGFLAVTLNHFGSTKLHYIHELVYTHFVGKIQPYHRVTHKNNDINDNYYKNLEQVSISTLLEKGDNAKVVVSTLNQKKPVEVVKPKKSAKPKKPAKPGPPKKKRKQKKILGELDAGVLQFTGEGKFVREHPTIQEAGIHLAIDPTEILNCLKGESKTAGGYQWYYRADPNFDDGVFDVEPAAGPPPESRPVPQSHRTKAVYQYDWVGNFIREFPSVKEAALTLGISSGGISYALKKFDRTSGGFRWKLKEK